VFLETSAFFFTAVDGLVAVGNIEEEIFFVVFLVEGSHGGAGWGNDVVDEEEECVLGSQMDPLSDEEVELSDGQIGRDQILLFVQVADPRFGSLLHDHRDSVGVLLADLLSFGPSLLEGVFFFVLPLHLDVKVTGL